MPQLTRAKTCQTFCFLFRQLRNAAWMKMNFKPSLPSKSRGENYTHSSMLWDHPEIHGQNPVVFVFTCTVKQEVVKRVAESVCKDGLQVPLQIESWKGIKESFQHVLLRRRIQYHEAKFTLSQRPRHLHNLKFQRPLEGANLIRVFGKGDFTASWCKV